MIILYIQIKIYNLKKKTRKLDRILYNEYRLIFFNV